MFWCASFLQTRYFGFQMLLNHIVCSFSENRWWSYVTSSIFSYWLMLVMSATVEREAHRDVKLSFSEGVKRYSLSEKNWHSASLLQLYKHHIRFTGVEKDSSYWSYLALCCSQEQITYTNLSLFWPWLSIIKRRNSKFARNVLGPKISAAVSSHIAPSSDLPERQHFFNVQTVSTIS